MESAGATCLRVRKFGGLAGHRGLGQLLARGCVAHELLPALVERRVLKRHVEVCGGRDLCDALFEIVTAVHGDALAIAVHRHA